MEQIEATGRFLSQLNQSIPIDAAFWVKSDPESRWRLYVASDKIDDSNFDQGYEVVGRVAEELADPNFNVFQVHLVGKDDPLARDVCELLRRYHGKGPIHYRDYLVGGAGVDELYVYPSPIAAPAA